MIILSVLHLARNLLLLILEFHIGITFPKINWTMKQLFISTTALGVISHLECSFAFSGILFLY